MGIKLKQMLSDTSIPVLRDMMIYNDHDLILTPVRDNVCFLFDWTKDIRESLCRIELKDDCTCILTGMKKDPGLTFRKDNGDVIGFVPLRDDLTGIRDDVEYPFLDIMNVEIKDMPELGMMQGLSLICD